VLQMMNNPPTTDRGQSIGRAPPPLVATLPLAWSTPPPTRDPPPPLPPATNNVREAASERGRALANRRCNNSVGKLTNKLSGRGSDLAIRQSRLFDWTARPPRKEFTSNRRGAPRCSDRIHLFQCVCELVHTCAIGSTQRWLRQRNRRGYRRRPTRRR